MFPTKFTLSIRKTPAEPGKEVPRRTEREWAHVNQSAVVDEVLDIVDWYCEAESTEEDVSHICYADDLACEVEKGATGISGIYVGVCLYVDKALECPVFGADDAEPILGVAALESVGIEVDPRNQRLKRLPATRLK